MDTEQLKELGVFMTAKDRGIHASQRMTHGLFASSDHVSELSLHLQLKELGVYMTASDCSDDRDLPLICDFTYIYKGRAQYNFRRARTNQGRAAGCDLQLALITYLKFLCTHNS